MYFKNSTIMINVSREDETWTKSKWKCNQNTGDYNRRRCIVMWLKGKVSDSKPIFGWKIK